MSCNLTFAESLSIVNERTMKPKYTQELFMFVTDSSTSSETSYEQKKLIGWRIPSNRQPSTSFDLEPNQTSNGLDACGIVKATELLSKSV